MIRQLMGSFETPAQQEARARRMVDTMLQPQYAAAAESNRLAQEQLARQQQAALGYELALHNLAGREAEQTAAIYGRTGTEMGDFARSLAYGIVAPRAAAALQGAQGQTSAVVQGDRGTTVAAPDMQAQAGVENYLGGTLPVSDVNAKEAQQYVTSLLSAKGNDARTNQLLDQYATQARDAQDKLTAARADIAAQGSKSVLDLLGQYATQQSNNQARLAQLYTLRSSMRASEAGITGIDPVTGKPTLAAISASNRNLGYSKMITRQDGSVVGVHKDGTMEVVLPPNSVAVPYRGGNWQMKVMPDGSTRYFNPQTRQTVMGAPKGTFLRPKTLKPPTAKTIQGAVQYLDRWQAGYATSEANPGKPLTVAEVTAIAKAAGVSVDDLLYSNDKKAQKARDSSGLTLNQAGQHDDQEIQNLYVGLIQQYGIPAKRAFQMIAKRFPVWAAHMKPYYFPKGL